MGNAHCGICILLAAAVMLGAGCSRAGGADTHRDSSANRTNALQLHISDRYQNNEWPTGRPVASADAQRVKVVLIELIPPYPLGGSLTPRTANQAIFKVMEPQRYSLGDKKMPERIVLKFVRDAETMPELAVKRMYYFVFSAEGRFIDLLDAEGRSGFDLD